jgi:hypothetical protein
MAALLENFDVDVRDRFVESVGESKFSELKPMLIDGSYIEMHQWLSSILTANNDGEDIKLKLKNLSSRYKSESDELFNEKQKDLIIRHLEKEVQGFHFKDEEELTESINIDELKREILRTPRLSKKSKEIITNYGTAEISYLLRLSKSEQKATLYDELSQIGLGRKLKVRVAELISSYQ